MSTLASRQAAATCAVQQRYARTQISVDRMVADVRAEVIDGATPAYPEHLHWQDMAIGFAAVDMSVIEIKALFAAALIRLAREATPEAPVLAAARSVVGRGAAT